MVLRPPPPLASLGLAQLIEPPLCFPPDSPPWQVHWVDIGLVANSKFVPLLFSVLGSPDEHLRCVAGQAGPGSGALCCCVRFGVKELWRGGGSL